MNFMMKKEKIKAWAVIDNDKNKISESCINNLAIFTTKKEALRFGYRPRFSPFPVEIIIKSKK